MSTTIPTTAVEQAILSRRNVKPTSMNGKKIADETVQQLLQLADWAPTHGYTEPWYFVVFGGDKVSGFCTDHAELYKQHTPADKFIAGNYDKLKSQGDLASHVIAICMKRGSNPKIPVLEETASVACAVENMWLAATAQDIAAYWGSGGMTYHPAMKDYLGLGEEDQVLGFFYLGYTDEPAANGKRVKPLSEKVKWM
ncbi:nitroreductase family protein [Chitinophaga nivalis]|uniref:Nitroreductase n=1 Tax=Chitinophaga nivalis TaxID=2991709 RepID=A0ABT3IEX3_9BACT|nr:nitroreductase [Chitinophaga nivalis]MCW3467807.1 nitroreductase [Chitinophaga nivalis]MCW3482501.1 nitroreductase [Chitinophaga nivalis]